MSNVYFTSDWHLGHRNILKYRGERFKTIEEHDNAFIDAFNSVVGKRDTVFFLGDIAFTEEGLEKIGKLRYCAKKVLYLGNHDTLPAESYLKYFDEVHAFRSYKGYWLTHCPIHPTEMRRRKGCIHGHLHANYLADSTYFDVSPEKHDFKLVPFDVIKAYFEEQNND